LLGAAGGSHGVAGFVGGSRKLVQTACFVGAGRLHWGWQEASTWRQASLGVAGGFSERQALLGVAGS
jgi:hypothetical protein